MTGNVTRRPLQPDSPPRGGFTLVELLVVIGIMIILTVMTIAMVNITQDEDRVREGAAQVQSYLEGARDRAIQAKEPRGVRFITDTQNPNVATSLLYIGAPEIYGNGDSLTLRRLPGSSADEIVPRNGWDSLFDRGLISEGSPIFIGTDNNDIQQFFTIDIQNAVNPAPGQSKYRFYLTKRYPGGPVPAPQGYSLTLYYRIPLNPTVLPNQEPRQLPRDVVIDLNHSVRPAAWGTPGAYNTLDVMFSPNGTVVGLVASAGVIHLVVADQADVDREIPPGYQTYNDPTLGSLTREGNERIVSLRTQTGGISVHNVDVTDDDSDNVPDDPFKFAASGEPAK